MSSLADITFTYVLEDNIKPSVDNSGRRDTFKIFQQIALKNRHVQKSESVLPLN